MELPKHSEQLGTTVMIKSEYDIYLCDYAIGEMKRYMEERKLTVNDGGHWDYYRTWIMASVMQKFGINVYHYWNSGVDRGSGIWLFWNSTFQPWLKMYYPTVEAAYQAEYAKYRQWSFANMAKPWVDIINTGMAGVSALFKVITGVTVGLPPLVINAPEDDQLDDLAEHGLDNIFGEVSFQNFFKQFGKKIVILAVVLLVSVVVTTKKFF